MSERVRKEEKRREKREEERGRERERERERERKERIRNEKKRNKKKPQTQSSFSRATWVSALSSWAIFFTVERQVSRRASPSSVLDQRWG